MADAAAHPDHQETARKLWSLIRDINFAMLTTTDPSGALRSRPMATQQAEFDGELWFFTRASAPKVGEVEARHQVNVSYAEPKNQTYVSVSGEAELVRDPAKIRELWSEGLKTWFPRGLDDPDIALLRVEVDQAEYWDGPSSLMVQAYGYAKAVLTGRSPQTEHEKLKM